MFLVTLNFWRDKGDHMKVKCIKLETIVKKDSQAKYGYKTERLDERFFLEINKEYDVHVLVFNRFSTQYVLRLDKEKYPLQPFTFVRSELFEIIDNTIPSNWAYTYMPLDDNFAYRFIGPKSFTEDPLNLERLAEFDSDIMKLFD